MRLRGLVHWIVIIMLLGGLLLDISTMTGALADENQKIEAALLNEFALQGETDFIVRFSDQPDLSAAYQMDWCDRGEYVVRMLELTVARSQSKAKGLLASAGMKYHTFTAGNELYVWHGDITIANSIASLIEVETIRQTRTYSIDPLIDYESILKELNWAGDLLAYNMHANTGEAVNSLAWGIAYTKADDFWVQFGLQGDGMIVAGIDTGVQWDHPSLDQSFHCGTDPYDPKCWEDPSNICGGSVCDNNGHGTHIMGTMVADDDPTLLYQAGMAPNAKWIACKGCEDASCSDFALNACADWILAPGGNPANRPHVVNNSWGGSGGDTWYAAKVEAWVAAGIFPAFSAGNSGPACNTLGSPGDYQLSFSTAANDPYGNIGSFSSRGPSAFGHDPYTKPNITAPGVNICSAYPDSGWSCGFSGTSMATPHTAGAVALLWSCSPGLVGDVDATFQALQMTASTPPAGTCGAPQDGEGNYTFGYGYLDILAAGTVYCGNVEKGYLHGYVTAVDSGEPIQGATVSVNTGLMAAEQIDSLTDPTGYYTMTLPVGTYDVTASKYGYSSQTYNVSITKDSIEQQDFELQWIGHWIEGPADPTNFTRYDCTWFDDGSGESSYNQKVYCMGGRTDSDGESGEIWRFDPNQEVFTFTGDQLVHSVSNYTANVVKDTDGWAIYVIGGFDIDETGGVVDYVQRYEPKGGSVQDIDTDPVPLKVSEVLATPGACVSVHNKIYCFGGWESEALPYFSTETWIFDPAQPAGSKWDLIESAQLSVPRGYIQSAVQNGTIYAMGGISGFSDNDLVASDVVEALDVYDLEAGWKLLDPLPVATAEGRGFGFSSDTLIDDTDNWTGKLYVVGGGDWPSESTEVLEFNLVNGEWSTAFPELINARRDHAGVYVPLCSADPGDGLPGMWVFGGRQGTDEPPYLEPEFFPMDCYDPPQQLKLVKTVGTDRSCCADSDHVYLPAPGEVTYCFTLINSSEITITRHDLQDDHLGVLLDGEAKLLPPGDSFFITTTVTISETTINLAVWTGYDEGIKSYPANDYAIVAINGSYHVIKLPVVYK